MVVLKCFVIDVNPLTGHFVFLVPISIFSLLVVFEDFRFNDIIKRFVFYQTFDKTQNADIKF